VTTGRLEFVSAPRTRHQAAQLALQRQHLAFLALGDGERARHLYETPVTLHPVEIPDVAVIVEHLVWLVCPELVGA